MMASLSLTDVTEPFFFLRAVGWYFYFYIQTLIERSVSKQWRP